MSEDEWFSKGDERLEEWARVIIAGNNFLTDGEESAFEYAWELAGREMGIVE